MGKILVYCEATNDDKLQVSKASLSAIQASIDYSKIKNGDEIHILLIGEGAKERANGLLNYGATTIHWFDQPIVSQYRSQSYAKVVSNILSLINADTFICAATAVGKDLAPCVAGLIDAGQASDIVGINSDGTFCRPMYAGDLLADVEILTNKRVITIRSSAFSLPVLDNSKTASVSEVSNITYIQDLTEVVSNQISKSTRPELSSASIVVSGGRAIGSSDNFEKFIFPLADILGGAVGASRAAVDAGYAPNDWQVGQTGKVVAPDLYIAVGISGAIQHLAGMKDSKIIVAINKDPEAPIFEMATYGLVADLFQALPSITESIKQLKS